MPQEHPFDLSTDGCYDPDSDPDVYLTETQVKEAISSLRFDDARNKAALELIEAAERLQREKCLGTISPSEKSASTQALHKAFQRDFHCWAYVTDAYKEFYRHFGVEE